MVDPNVLQKAKDKLDEYVKNPRVKEGDEDTFYLIEAVNIPGYMNSLPGNVVALPKKYVDQLVEVDETKGTIKLDYLGYPIPVVKPEQILYTANVDRNV